MQCVSSEFPVSLSISLFPYKQVTSALQICHHKVKWQFLISRCRRLGLFVWTERAQDAEAASADPECNNCQDVTLPSVTHWQPHGRAVYKCQFLYNECSSLSDEVARDICFNYSWQHSAKLTRANAAPMYLDMQMWKKQLPEYLNGQCQSSHNYCITLAWLTQFAIWNYGKKSSLLSIILCVAY